MKRILRALILAVAASVPASGQLRNLEEGYPVQMEDAEVLPYGILQGQATLMDANMTDGTYGYQVVSGLEIGFAPRWQALLTVPVVWGTTLQTTGTGLSASIMYALTRERPGSPALALDGAVNMPMALVVQNADFRLKGIATKTLDPAYDLRMHVNLLYGYLSNPGINERRSYASAQIGVSRTIARGMTLAADFSHEETRISTLTFNVIEAGIRRSLGPSATVSVSAGAGVGSQSLAYRLAAGIQIWLCDLICPPRRPAPE